MFVASHLTRNESQLRRCTARSNAHSQKHQSFLIFAPVPLTGDFAERPVIRVQVLQAHVVRSQISHVADAVPRVSGDWHAGFAASLQRCPAYRFVGLTHHLLLLFSPLESER